MEARILKEKGERDVATIKELNLDSCKSTNVAGLSEDWKSLENLVLSNVGLTSLKGFPRLPNLKKLELNKNNLCEGLDALACLPKLEELDLSGNEVKDFDAVQPLAEVGTLKCLILKGCDVCKVKDYKTKMFDLIPSLEELDGEKKEKVQENGVKEKNGTHEVVDLEDSDDDDDDDDVVEEEVGDDGSVDEEEESEEENDIPLEALYKKIDDEEDMEDDDDFEAEEEVEGSDEEIEDEDEDLSVNISQNSVEEPKGARGTKRKHENEEN